jgi:hypothetical protein
MNKEVPWNKEPFAYLNQSKTTIVSTANTNMATIFSLINKDTLDLYKQFDLFLQDIVTLPKDYYLATGNICQERYDRFIKFTIDERQLLLESFLNKNIDQYKFVLYQRAFKSMSHYIRDIYFEKYDIKVWDDALQTVQEKYPLVPKHMIDKIQEKKFIKQLAPKIIDTLEKELPNILPKIIEHKQQNLYVWHNMYTVILYSILDSLLVSLCSDEHLWGAINDHRHELVNKLLAPIQEKKQRQILVQQEKEERKKQREQIQEYDTEPIVRKQVPLLKPTPTLDKSKNKQFDQVFSLFENATKAKLWKGHEEVKSYVLRMYKKKQDIYMKRIQQIVWPSFDDEVIDLVRDLCNKLDLAIVELEKFVEEVTVTSSVSKTPQKEIKEQVTETIASPILQSIANTPEKLTTDLLITICKELWYRFLDENAFIKEAWWLGLNKEWNASLIVRKKLIDLLKKPEEVCRDFRTTKWTNYQRLDLNHGVRLVKQGKTICSLIKDRDKYNQYIQSHFITNQMDYDKIPV